MTQHLSQIYLEGGTRQVFLVTFYLVTFLLFLLLIHRLIFIPQNIEESFFSLQNVDDSIVFRWKSQNINENI